MSDENGNGNGNGKVQFRKKDGVEKDGFICFPVATEPEEVEQEEEEEEVQEDRPPPVNVGLETCPEDPRYQQCNKTKWCSRMYIDYHRCRYLLGENANQCNYFYKCYHSICPTAWHEKWDEQLKRGNFPVDITHDLPPPKEAPCP